MVSSVSPPPAFTRLPTVTCVRLILPLMGAKTLVKSRSSLACSMAAKALWTSAAAVPSFAFQTCSSVSLTAPDSHQWIGPRVFGLGQFQAGLGAAFLRLGGVQRGLVGPGVDFVEQIAFLDHLPVLEIDRFKMSPDARSHFDFLHGCDAPFVVVVVDHFSDNRLTDGDRRRWSFRHWRCRGAAAKHTGYKEDHTAIP